MTKSIIIALALLLTGCGFHPLYQAEGDNSKIVLTKLASIDIAPIPDRLGQIMRNRMLDLFGSSTLPDYRLTVVISDEIEGYGFRSDAAVTQEQVTVTAVIALKAIASDALEFETTLRARTSYDVVLSDFATYTQREDAKRRLVEELAEQLHRRIALHFRKQ